MYFQLLRGMHRENGVDYKVAYEQNDQGVRHCVDQPVIESESDLVKNFGAEKFRRLSDNEAKAILRVDEETTIGDQESETTLDPLAPESDVTKAAKEGAAEIAEPIGKDVTDRFPGAKVAGLSVYKKPTNKAKRYVVTSLQNGADMFLTEEPIKKVDVEKLIEQWSE
jgi:hypothetical protein